MTINVFGWAGMTIVGTAITLLPTILHVRSPQLRALRSAPWLMAGGLLVVSIAVTTGQSPLAATGMGSYAAGLALFAAHAKGVLATPRRRRIPTAGFHLLAAIAWALITAGACVVTLLQADDAATRDLVVVGGAAGFTFQALLGAWSFLLPSTRAPVAAKRRRELVAMEIGGRVQVLAYNSGLVLALCGLRAGSDLAVIGTWLAWTAAAWALLKAWFFPLLSALPSVERRATAWWADPESRATAEP